MGPSPKSHNDRDILHTHDANDNVTEAASAGDASNGSSALPAGGALDPTGTLHGGVLAWRQAWGAGDQALFSATSFACAVAIGRAGTVREFGAFGAIYLVYVLALGAVEAFTAEVVVVRASGGTASHQRELLRGAAACALLAGVPASFFGLIALLAGDGPFGALAPPVLLLAPLLFLQNLWRYALFALSRPRAAFANDLLWVLIETVAFGLLARSGAAASSYVWAWGGAGAVACVVGSFQTSVVPVPAAAAGWVRLNGRLGSRFAGEYLTLFGAAQGVLGVVCASAGLVAAAGYRGGQLVYGPLQVVLNAVRLSFTPVIARANRAGWEGVGRAAVVMALALSSLAAAWCLAVLNMPDGVGEAILGESWHQARMVLLPMGITSIALGVSLAALVVLRVLEAVERSFPVRIILASLIVVLGASG
ncbi:MAG: hypothetical protein LC808_26150, partial [Actinobacteria bacterium]|nr:hypothetical protein [Actinomycetota bacterium]